MDSKKQDDQEATTTPTIPDTTTGRFVETPHGICLDQPPPVFGTRVDLNSVAWD